RPIEAVVNTAENLATGELAARVPRKSKIATTELRDLASNFDDIAHRIQDDRNRLHNAVALATAADRAKSEFLANVSHELRTPLNAIIGFSDSIKQETLGPIGNERYNSYAAYIHQSGQHLL
ncbi:MAG: hypothetical protein OEU46_11595, partial [Alphaproteobacteria bacterium]|nr:hypothetical protein [Alphaproteobacteria bacterium]